METVCEGKALSFPDEEVKILALWDELDAFKEQLRRTEGSPEFVFYDGPPFATGLPHYGHLLAGSIKDIVTRYASQTGRHVSRRFGWDCHGLPVEFEIDKKLGIKQRSDVLKLGIDKYNEECRSIVMTYSAEWEKTVHRLGRWIDFENDYKTLDPTFMESVWWVFGQLWEKGLVYKGFKVMPYSTKCSTTLSNFEAGLNYKDVSDPFITVAFKLDNDPDGASMVAWTTTPWTLPSNLALCVHPEMTYVKVRNPATQAVYICLEARLSEIPGAVPKPEKAGGKKKSKSAEPPAAPFEVLSSFQGKELEGATYVPLFPYFEALKGSGAFRVICDTYVKADGGTGVVHNAPAFGEDDMRICIAKGIIQRGGVVPCPVDADGCFTDEVSDFASKHVKDADKAIIAHLKKSGAVVDSGALVHSYPFCWRSDTPLIYKAVPSWFIQVTAIKERLLANNQLTSWVPSYVKEKRFHNWLKDANDWAVSRSRFWGTPLPVWASDDGEEIVVISSKAQLEELTGTKVDDLHRHFIDHLEIPSKQGKGTLKRDDAVFDCWFESGSMPYGQNHYPFENKQYVEDNFPADFVAEGLDQTRGWFYTLMVLSTALFDKPAFKNLVCNGLILTADGKKMSKRLQNYPDPMLILNEHGADALRLYLINSPVVRAETLCFKEAGVKAIVKDVFLPWYNAYRFLVQNVERWQSATGKTFSPSPSDNRQTNVMDRWISASTRLLVNYVRQEMDAYRLYTVVPYLVAFVEKLTNIYVRYNRKRLKGAAGEDDSLAALSTLYATMMTLCKVMAPFTPFLTEHMYQNLRRAAPDDGNSSVHFCQVPPATDPDPADVSIQQSVERMQKVIEVGRVVRERNVRPLKVPLKEVVVVHSDTSFLSQIEGELKVYVEEELNAQSVVTCSQEERFCRLKATPDFKLIGARRGKSLGKGIAQLTAAIKALSPDEVRGYVSQGSISVNGIDFSRDDEGGSEIQVLREFLPPEGRNVSPSDMDADGDGQLLVVLDLRSDHGLQLTGLARELINRVQKLRKTAGLVAIDPVSVFYSPQSEGELLQSALQGSSQRIRDTLGALPQLSAMMPAGAILIAEEDNELRSGDLSARLTVILTQPCGAAHQPPSQAQPNGTAPS